MPAHDLLTREVLEESDVCGLASAGLSVNADAVKYGVEGLGVAGGSDCSGAGWGGLVIALSCGSGFVLPA